MVIVIGATGFIGMYTVDRFLEEGYEVLATGRNAIMKQELEAKGVTCVSLDKDFSWKNSAKLYEELYENM